LIKPLIKLPLAVDYLFDSKIEKTEREIPANVENANDSEVSRLKNVIRELTSKLDQKVQSLAELNGRVANLTLLLNEAEQKNRIVSNQYERKLGEVLNKNVQLNGNLTRVSLDFDDKVKALKKINNAMEEKYDNLLRKTSTLNTQLSLVSLGSIEESKPREVQLKDVNSREISIVQPQQNLPVNSVEKVADINQKLAVLSLNYDSMVQRKNKELNEMNKNVENLREKVSDLNTRLAVVTLNTNDEVKQAKKNVEAQAERADKLSKVAANLNNRVATLTLAYNDDVRALKQKNNEKDQKIEHLQNSNARINSQLANLTLNVDDTVRDLKNARNVEYIQRSIKSDHVVDITPREVVEASKPVQVVVVDSNDALKSKMAQINTQLAKLTLDSNEEVRSLVQNNKEKQSEIEKLRNKLGQINTQVAIISLYANEVEKANAKMERNNREVIDEIRAKLAETNGNLARVSVNSRDEIINLKKSSKDYDYAMDILRSKLAKVNSNLAVVTLDSNESINNLKKIVKEDEKTIESLRTKAAEINTNLAKVSLGSNSPYTVVTNEVQAKEIVVPEVQITPSKSISQDLEETLRAKAADINTRLAVVTLNFDNEVRTLKADQKRKDMLIEELREKSAVINNNLAKLTLTIDEVSKNNGLVTKQKNETKFRDIAVKLNQNLSALTLDYDDLKKKSRIEQKEKIEKIEKLQKERSILNNNLAKVTLQYDEDMAKRNRVIKNLNEKLNATNAAYNNARRGSVIAKIQTIERLTDMSTNLNSNLAKVTLEYNEMVQSKDAEISKLKKTLDKYESVDHRRTSVITVEYNNSNYYNKVSQNENTEKVVNKEMGSLAPAAEPDNAPVDVPASVPKTEVIQKKEVQEKKKSGKKEKKSSKKNKTVVKKNIKYSDLSIEQRKAMNKELVDQSCNIL